MSELILGNGGLYAPAFPTWQRKRPFYAALVASLLMHAALISVIPGFRAVPFEAREPLTVEIIEAAPAPQAVQQPPQRKAEPERRAEPPANPPAPPRSSVAPRISPAPEPELRVAPAPAPVPEQVVPPEPARAEPPREVFPDLMPSPAPEPPAPAPRTEVTPPTPPLAPEPAAPPQSEAQAPRAPVPPARAEEQTAAAPAAPAADPPPAARESVPRQTDGLVASYEKRLSDLIRRHEYYPERARRQGWEGKAVVGLNISAEGRVTDISLLESTGREILDEAALRMVQRASPLPQAPDGLRGKQRIVRVPIVFKLQSS